VTIGQEVNGVVVPIRTVDDLVREIGTSSFVLTQRYHGALAALALGIPFEAVAQGEGDKLADLQKPHSVEEWKTRIADGERELRLALKG
jgi:polysaccharide pyruvyl transferase WcaK-like protein